MNIESASGHLLHKRGLHFMENIVKQYAFNKFGSEDVFEEIETKLSLSDTKDILVKVERVGINPVDTMHRSGVLSSDKSPNSYIVLGSELQGEIIDMLNPIPGLSIGDKVIVKMTTGAYADKVAVNHSHVFKIPDGMPLDFAAGFSSTAITAYCAVNGPFYDFKSGDTVAVIGTSGAVGSFVIQLLKEKMYMLLL